MKYKVIIVGGGASGLMLASLLPKNTTLVIESNAKLAAKVHVSGGGKCNITNSKMGSEYFLADKEFIAPALKKFNEKSLLSWLSRQGLEPEIRKETQYFCKNSSKELVTILEKESRKQSVHLNENVLSASKKSGIFFVQTNKNLYECQHLVIASGGLSFPKLGASSVGYDLAISFGHSVTKVAPALVGFTVQKEQFFFKELSGASCDVEIEVSNEICSGALLFTHKGMSGPAILDASLFWEKGKIKIDFLPAFNWKTIKDSRKNISTLLPLPKRITKAFLVQFNLSDKPFNMMSVEEIEKLKVLNHYILSPAGTFGYSKAEVTKGGIDTDEIEKETMMSKKEEALYFLGEVLNVTGKLGGYNFQWAFSSAYVCSRDLKGKI
ncbi:MAG: NAD(FAD)-utilizing dehydrogenases [uncultured Sulfurovum sp.]|uniref:NAD(FAD)-utilizing dehydrogenases n=1 Tax=uncultured Sulfurovum sp. TaxID=269237 RepID=A0A6S6UD74_9BACT|nr:MAG: NAD(FAD)-utilizing dehydrogenases [uncultured Sulfurovum sp.]